MKIVDGAQSRLWPWLAQHHRPRPPRQHLGEAKPAVKSIGGFGQIAPRIFGLPHGVVPWGLPLVVAATDRTLDVAEHHVDQARALDLGRRASARGFQHGMRVICLLLQFTLLGWLPATIWAVYALSQYKTDQKIKAASRNFN